MKISEIIEYTRELAPYETAAEWDNVGLLAGSENTDVGRVLLALDVTAETALEAASMGAELIISHHPVIFAPLRALKPDTAPYLLVRNDIAALCLHTNLDRAGQGVNKALADALELENVTLYPEDFLAAGDVRKPCSADEFAAFVKERLGAPSVRYTEGSVSRLAVSSGGGGEGVELREKYGFDAFVTGEMKHHQFIYAAEHGTAAFDAGHFSTEDVVIEPLKRALAERFPEIEFIKSQKCRCPYKAI